VGRRELFKSCDSEDLGSSVLPKSKHMLGCSSQRWVLVFFGPVQLFISLCRGGGCGSQVVWRVWAQGPQTSLKLTCGDTVPSGGTQCFQTLPSCLSSCWGEETGNYDSEDLVSGLSDSDSPGSKYMLGCSSQRQVLVLLGPA
jgi:hypothetical protein